MIKKIPPKSNPRKIKKTSKKKGYKKRKKPVKLEYISFAYAKRQGWEPDITEHWLIPGRKKKDLYGFIDMLVLTPTNILGVQITTKQNVNARIKKIQASPIYPKWRQSGGLLEVWGWYRDNNNIWQLQITKL